MSVVRLSVLLCLLLTLPRSASAEADFSVETSAEADERPKRRSGILVVVQAGLAHLEGERVRQAIEAELNVPVYGEQDALAVGTLWVTATGEDELVMVFSGPGRRHERNVRLPTEPHRRLETVGLVAGNLVRDETGELIEELRPPTPLDSEAAPPAVDVARPAGESASRTSARKARAKPTPEPAAPSTPADAAEAMERRLLNLSVYHPLALYPDSHRLEFNAELGLAFSDVGRIRGVALSLFVNRVRHGLTGLQVSGIANLSAETLRGASVTGIFTQHRGDLNGALISGAALTNTGEASGATIAGVFSWQKGPIRGVQIAGLIGIADDLSGFQMAGGINLAEKVKGAQVANLVNVSTSAEGAMLSGGANIAQSELVGAQISAVNLAQSVRGFQLGLVNVASKVKGAQIGLVNVAEEVDGVSLGLVPWSEEGRQHIVLWTGNALANVGFKFRVGPLYTLLGIGYSPRDEDVQARFSPGAALGAHVDVGPAFLELDALYQSQHDLDEPSQPRQAVSLRPQLGVALHRKLSVFGGLAAEADVEAAAPLETLALRGLLGVQLF